MEGNKPRVRINFSKSEPKRAIGHRALLIAESRGTAGAKVLVKDVDLDEVEGLFGKGGLATFACKRFKSINPFTPLDVIPLAEPSGGTQAEGGITITGTATEARELKFRIADDQFSYKIQVNAGTSNTQVALDIKTAVESDSLPFTIEIDSSNANIIKLKALAKGLSGNNLICKFENRVPGLTFATIPFTGGGGVYDTGGILESIEGQYGTIMFDVSTDIDLVNDYLEERFDIDNSYYSGSSFVFLNETDTQLKNYLIWDAGGKERRCVTLFANLPEIKINAIPILAVAEFGAKRTLRLLDGADIRDIVANPDVTEGGDTNASLPYHNTPMTYVGGGNALKKEDYILYEAFGVSFILPDEDFPAETLLGQVNTLTRDPKFRKLNTIDCLRVVAKRIYSGVKTEYRQSRAAKDGSTGGGLIATEPSIATFIKSKLLDCVDELILSSEEDSRDMIDNEVSVLFDRETDTFVSKIRVMPAHQFSGFDLTLNHTITG